MLSGRSSSKLEEQKEKNTKIIEGYGVNSFAVMRQNAPERRITEFLSCQDQNSHVARDKRMDVLTRFADIQRIAALTLQQIKRVISGHWERGP